MKTLLYFALSTVMAAFCVSGQGFVYDQQSGPDNGTFEGGVFLPTTEPAGQSFTPSFDSVDFISLELYDLQPGNFLGATVYVNLLENSITGAVLATSSSISMPDGFLGFENFFFVTTVSVTPGTTYYFQTILQSGDEWVAAWNIYSYSGGMAFQDGLSRPLQDLWFREGIVVPEPSSAWLFLLGSGILIYVRKYSKRQSS